MVRLTRRHRHCSGKMALLTATADGADQAPQSPILGVVLVKLSLHAKNQPDLTINAARADFLGFLLPISAPNLS